jgi:hypothetical protein
MSSPWRYTERISGVAQDGRIDKDLHKRKDLGPPLAYSPSAVLFLTGPVPFVNEEDFRSPLDLLYGTDQSVVE